MSKKLISLLLTVSMLLCLSACSSDKTNKENDENNTETSSETVQSEEEISSETETIQNEERTSSEPTSSQEPEEVKLSENCNKVLASGYDANDNFYELVANEKEDYLGTTIEMGVIKNNEWIIPLTTKAPFISETGLLVGAAGNYSGSIYDEKFAVFNYIGAGCFHYGNIIWNSNANKTYTPTDGGTFVIKGNSPVVNNDGLFLIEKYGSNFKILYANTMSVKEMDLHSGLYFNKCFPISENLFACIDGSHDVKTNGFYDINGKKVIDLSKYKLMRSPYGYARIPKDLVFENGKCTFTITNDQGTEFDITIDKTGKVINSVQK